MFEIAGISLAIAFAAGLLSCLSPCVLPMVPTYISYLSGTALSSTNGNVTRLFVFNHAMAFVAGFTAVFMAVGASVGLVGWVLRDNLDVLGKIAGITMILFGLHLSGILNIPWLERRRQMDYEPLRSVGYVRSFLIGSAYGVGWTPCIGPTLGAILGLAATSATVLQGTTLLVFYSAGLAIPFLAMGIAFNSTQHFFKMLRPTMGLINFISGVLLIVVGVLVFTGSLVQINRFFGFGPGGVSGIL